MKTIILAIAALLAASSMAQNNMIKETKAERDARMEWWREARFGMFIHWGLYSIPAGEWGNSKGYGEWIRDSARIPIGQYNQFLNQFNPTKFDADAWAKMAKDAGMKYLVITTKHHDGFSLFDSKASDDWDVMASPFKRDIMKELADACRRHGVVPGWYHSIMDWHHPDYLPRRPWELADRPEAGAKMDRYVEYLRQQVTELLTNYGDMGVMWFDGEWESTWSDYYGKPLYELCRELQPKVIVNNRVSNSRGGSMEEAGLEDDAPGDFSTPEQHIPATGLPGVDWETCMTMNSNWGYNRADTNWKSTATLIQNLVDIASKGGNYLLNIGPTAAGEFPPEAVERLKEIGDWMRVNGDSIYGTKASLFEALPWGRSTTKGSTLYLHVFDWPKDGKLVLPGVGNEAVGASLMGGGAYKVRRSGANIVLEVPKTAPGGPCPTIELKLDGSPIIYQTPKIVAPAPMLVGSIPVSIQSGSKELDVRYTLDGKEPTEASLLYRRPFPLHRTTTVVAAAFHKGKKVSGSARLKVVQVKPWPSLRMVRVPDDGIRMDVYKGNWDKLPDFTKLVAQTQGVVGSIALDLEETPEEFVGRRYTGFIHVPDSEVYAFALTSDDGAQLWIDEKLVIDHDGLHAPTSKSGFAPLTAGYHRIDVRWFNKTGGAALNLYWGKVGTKLRAIDASSLKH